MPILKCNGPVCWPTRTGWPPLALVVALVAIVGLSIPAARSAELDFGALFRSGSDLAGFLGHFFALPDWSYLPKMALRFWETIEITLVGSFLAVVVSLPLAVLAARNTSPHLLCCHGFRAFLCLVRALPEMVWALLFVSALGLGPIPGVLAMALVSIGFMGRFFAEALEVVDIKGVEGVRAHGARWGQTRLYGLFPQAMPDIAGTILYLLDHNLRAATLLGLVGAGGIGYDMILAMKLFQFDRLLMIMTTLFLLILALDRISARVRNRYI